MATDTLRLVCANAFLENFKLHDYPLGERQRTAPGMLSPEERAMLFELVKSHYEGKGAIIDGGSFFGSSLVASASGLTENPQRESMDFSQFPEGKPIHGYELGFLPKPKAKNADLNRVFQGTPYVMGESFLPLLEENVAEFSDIVSLHIGDLNNEGWNGAPIEIAFIDVCKTIRLNAHVTQNFLPHLIGGQSYLINQDFFFDRLPWIKVTMGYLKDYFRWEGQVFTSSVYSCTKQIPQEIAAFDPFREASYEECLNYHDAVDFPMIDRRSLFCLDVSRGYLMALKDHKDDALEHLRAVEDEYQDLFENETTIRNNRFRLERAVRQITNGNIFKVS